MNSTMHCRVEGGGRVQGAESNADGTLSPEKLMELAEGGHLPKEFLVNLLAIDNRRPYLDACAAIEKKYTEACTAMNDPCLEAGCALEGEICLEPLLRAGPEYHKACAAEWMKLFADPRHRIDAWRH